MIPPANQPVARADQPQEWNFGNAMPANIDANLVKEALKGAVNQSIDQQVLPTVDLAQRTTIRSAEESKKCADSSEEKCPGRVANVSRVLGANSQPMAVAINENINEESMQNVATVVKIKAGEVIDSAVDKAADAVNNLPQRLC